MSGLSPLTITVEYEGRRTTLRYPAACDLRVRHDPKYAVPDRLEDGPFAWQPPGYVSELSLTITASAYPSREAGTMCEVRTEEVTDGG